MDEPFSALDALSRRKLREMMKSVKRELGIPIIHVTHDIREALFLADDIMPVVQGRMEPKWTLQFMLPAREFDRSMCKETRAGSMEDEEEDIELTIKQKEYKR
jgi:molybdate transport system ATP-binding protein